MKDKSDDITIKSIWKWLRSKSGKRYSFFIFYVLFFIFIFVLLSFTNNESNELEEEITLPYTFENFSSDESKFYYQIDFNDNQSEYLVTRNDNKLIVSDDRGTYEYTYQNGALVYDKEEEEVSNSKFLDIYLINRILKNAILDVETKKNSTKEYIYTYQIENEKLAEIVEETLVTGEDLNNEITIVTNSNKEIVKINLNLLNYVSSTSLIEVVTEKYEITLTEDTYE